jgi:hypothetical protein
MRLYWGKNATENYYATKYSLYAANVYFRDFIDLFRNNGGAQSITAKINFQEE